MERNRTLEVSLERRGATVVAVPREQPPVLTVAKVEEAMASLRPDQRLADSLQLDTVDEVPLSEDEE